MILGHGGGSYPHKPAKDYQTHMGFVNDKSKRGLAEVSDAAARLNRIVTRAMLDSGEDAISLQPSSASLTANGKITEWYTKSLEMIIDLKL